jgi:hypothetical protein
MVYTQIPKMDKHTIHVAARSRLCNAYFFYPLSQSLLDFFDASNDDGFFF